MYDTLAEPTRGFSYLPLLVLAAIIIAAVVIIAVIAGSKKKPAPVTGEGSYFDGNTFQLIGYRILTLLLCALTLGIAYPWVLCMVQRWETKHTVIHGRRLKFNGRGIQLIGKYLLWLFLTIITLGIYAIWFGLSMKKWVVKHTVYADDEEPVDSYFSGGAGGYLGIHILAFFLTVFTLGIGKAWADRMVLNWETKHTHVGGSPLEFNGTGGQLFGKYLLFVLLTPLTLGIYAIFFPVILLKWQTKHTEAVYQTPEIQSKAHAHESSAMQDFAKYRIAANDQEIAALKSGYTGNEDMTALEKLSEGNNPFAAYRLAQLLKGEAERYEGRSLELLQKAAEGKYHCALLDLAKQLPADQAIPVLTEAAQFGNAEATWILANMYLDKKDYPHAAYWYKVAMEWGIPSAVNSSDQYNQIVKQIALDLSEDRPMPKHGGGLVVLLVAVICVILALGACVVLGLAPVKYGQKIEGHNVAIRQDVFIVQSIPAKDVRGTERYSTDDNGDMLHYKLDNEMFFDYDSGILYFEFAEIECATAITLWDFEGWRTTPLYNSGIYQVSYTGATCPSMLGVCTGDSVRDYIYPEFQQGNSYDAQIWLDERIAIDDNTEEYTEPVYTEEDPNSAIIGHWYWEDMYTNIFTGDNHMQSFEYIFHSDGTFDYGSSEYMQTDNTNDTYINGFYWALCGGTGYSGTYTYYGDYVILEYYLEGNTGELNTVECPVSFDGETMTFSHGELSVPRTYTRIN